MIPLSVPHLGGNEWTYVKECLDTAWISSAGTFVDRFEEAVAGYTGAGHAVACVNGTAALQVALELVGVTAGEEVLVPTVTFVATVNAVAYLGARPVFMDADPFYNLDVEKTREFLDRQTEMRGAACVNRATGRRIAAILPVHVFGNAADLDALLPACQERGIAVVEDAAESLGTVYADGRHTGTLGAVGCLSFNGNKIITTGGGGMILTDDPALADRARYLTTQAKDDPVRYVHDAVGYNFRLTNLAAALGVAQMEQLPDFLERKREHWLAYRDAIAGIDGLELADVPKGARNNHWMDPLRIDAARYGQDREELMARLGSKGIQTRPLWLPNHLQRPFRDHQAHRIERALELHEQTLMLPCSAGLTAEQRETVVGELRHG